MRPPLQKLQLSRNVPGQPCDIDTDQNPATFKQTTVGDNSIDVGGGSEEQLVHFGPSGRRRFGRWVSGAY